MRRYCFEWVKELFSGFVQLNEVALEMKKQILATHGIMGSSQETIIVNSNKNQNENYMLEHWEVQWNQMRNPQIKMTEK
jgi:hypothetical protein